MTKYLTINGHEPKGERETQFRKAIELDRIETAGADPENWDNVMWLGYNSVYGDVFKAWDNGSEDDFCIYFGIKGDEFND